MLRLSEFAVVSTSWKLSRLVTFSGDWMTRFLLIMESGLLSVVEVEIGCLLGTLTVVTTCKGTAALL